MGVDLRAIALLAGGALTVAGPVAAAEDCSSDGTHAFRAEGLDAALASFTAARARAGCADDGQLAFNYARTLHAVLDRDGDDPRVCAAADAYGQAARAELPAAVQALAVEGRAKLAERCAAQEAGPADSADYTTLVERARTAVRAGDKPVAAVAWKAASAAKPDAALPHRALCSLLPDLGRGDEARGHCRQWRALEPQTAVGPVVGPADRTLAWVLTGGAAAALVGAGVSFVAALDAADEADAAARRGEAARAATPPDSAAYDAARRAVDAATDDTRTREIAAYALLGVAVGLGTWAALEWADDEGAHVALRWGGAGAWVEGRF